MEAYGIISRKPVIYCDNYEITPTIIKIDGEILGYLTSFECSKACTLNVKRTLPAEDGSDNFIMVEQTIRASAE